MHLFLALFVLTCIPSAAQPASPRGCLACHRGIESIREDGARMLDQIRARGRRTGDAEGCTVCHGGDAAAGEEEQAHGGAFYPDPGSPWINDRTCGQCHPDHVRVQWQSLMMTEAGKIQGTAWTFGAMTGYEHKWGNYAVENPKDKSARLGTDDYRALKERLASLEPQVFVERHEALPVAITDVTELKDHPEKAVFTYLRNQCQRCHLAVKGRQKRGDYRGMGCSACHLPYSTEGYYEGRDPTIPKDEPGHLLVHTIQGTREAKVNLHGHEYSGIPINTCTVCHNRGKRIGVSFQGLMETPYASPFTKEGGPQPKLHTKHYLAMEQDVHYKEGMLCQDCHTTLDVHGDGFLAATNLASVEIECTDCHGTPEAYPWELPLGYGDEFGLGTESFGPRGVAKEVLALSRQGTVSPPEDGYLLTARGNPFPHVVRRGTTVVVHTAAGKELKLQPLRRVERDNELSLSARVAMVSVKPHIREVECYTCHAAWSPQCYGCHVRIDYSAGKTCFDWLGAGHQHAKPGGAATRGEGSFDASIPGSVEEERSYTRFERPMLGVNGEGRVTPLIPGCQPAITVIGADGKPLLLNHLFRTPPNMEGSGKEGQLCTDMSPTQPHTITEHARDCDSCHDSEKALGYGIEGGRIFRQPDKPLIVDLETPEGHVLAQRAQPQCEPLDGLSADWSRIVTPGGKQVQTVGHHFKGSRPLNDEERHAIDRHGVCVGCHQEIPAGTLAVSLLHHVAEYTGQLPETAKQHQSLGHKIVLIASWVQVLSLVGLPVLVLAGVVCWRRRRARR